MTTRTTLLASLVAVAAAAGCYTGSATDTNRYSGNPSTETSGTDPEGENAPDAATEINAAKTGLPCDVASLLTTACGDCHGATLAHGAPNRLLTHADLTAPSEDDPARTVADVSLARMKATSRPMPPEGALTATRIAPFEKWIKDGLPKGSCGESTDGGTTPESKGDAGTKDAAPIVTSVCSSGKTWAQTDGVSALMAPGKACIACHSQSGGPSYVIAGTVYKTLHEPDKCNGVDGTKGVSVLIIDAAGVSHTMPVNAAGNFTRVTSIPMPYTAMVVRGTEVKMMKTPQTNGDCNGCHSEMGAGSPGRVISP